MGDRYSKLHVMLLIRPLMPGIPWSNIKLMDTYTQSFLCVDQVLVLPIVFQKKTSFLPFLNHQLNYSGIFNCTFVLKNKMCFMNQMELLAQAKSENEAPGGPGGPGRRCTLWSCSNTRRCTHKSCTCQTFRFCSCTFGEYPLRRRNVLRVFFNVQPSTYHAFNKSSS